MAFAGNIPGNYTVTINPISGSLPGAQIAKATSQNVNTGTAVSFTGGTVVYDTSSFSNLASHPTRLTVPAAGKYLILFTATTSVQGGAVQLYKNGSPLANDEAEASAANAFVDAVFIEKLAANDYLEIFNTAGLVSSFTVAVFSVQQVM